MSKEITTTSTSSKVIEIVTKMEGSGLIKFPQNYSPENALKSAFLQINQLKDKNGKNVLDVVTKDSLDNSLLDMIVQGLNPSKKQCYFIAWGNQLQLMRSYFGTMTATKRLPGVKDVKAQVVYQDDIFEYEINPLTADKKILRHGQKIENIDMNKIKAVYAIVVGEDNKPLRTEIMSMSQILDAWKMGKAFSDKNPNGSKAHQKFKDQMAMKTVINRVCKYYANTADDQDKFIEAYNRTTENEYINHDEDINEIVAEEVQEKANKEIPDIKISSVEEEKETPEKIEENKENDIQENQNLFNSKDYDPF